MKLIDFFVIQIEIGWKMNDSEKYAIMHFQMIRKFKPESLIKKKSIKIIFESDMNKGHQKWVCKMVRFVRQVSCLYRELFLVKSGMDL